jgi:hypothetical protein
VTDEIANKIREQNNRPDKKTIFAYDVLIWGKYKNKSEEKLKLWNLIKKKYRLKINMKDGDYKNSMKH